MRLGFAFSVLAWVVLAAFTVACDKSGHPSKTANEINGVLAEPGGVNTAPRDGGNPKAVHEVNGTLAKPAHINTSPEQGGK